MARETDRGEAASYREAGRSTATVWLWRGLLLAAATGALISCTSTAAQDLEYRIRSDMGVPLNADDGWAGALGQQVRVEADRPFRLRMEAASDPTNDTYALQVRRNEGNWETLEAQDFPYPKRELKLAFEGQPSGSRPPGWIIDGAAAADALTIMDDGSDRLLRAQGGERGVRAVYPAPWPLPEFSFAARFRLPAGGPEGFALLFSYV